MFQESFLLLPHLLPLVALHPHPLLEILAQAAHFLPLPPTQLPDLSCALLLNPLLLELLGFAFPLREEELTQEDLLKALQGQGEGEEAL